MAGKPPVWTFRGYELDADSFISALVELYRGEIDRSNTWRTRLDATTNSAIVVCAGTVLAALILPDRATFIMLFGGLLVALCLWVETRRYRYYELWSYRVRLMETDFFAAMLVPPFRPSEDWSESLANALLQPEFPITIWEALGRRFRRNYMGLYILLAGAWGGLAYLWPTPAPDLNTVFRRADLGALPGEAVVALAGAAYLGLFLMGFITTRLHAATGEVLPKYQAGLPGLEGWQTPPAEAAPGKPPDPRTARPSRPRPQALALVITLKPDLVTQRILKELRRGLTTLSGTGAFTRQERPVLLVALTITEIAQLKSIVRAEDPNAFIIVVPAREIFGRGFKSLFEG